MSSTLTIGLVQFDIAWENPGENIRRVETILRSTGPLDMVLLPEMWSTGFSMKPEFIAEDAETGPAISWMKAYAVEKRTTLCGSIATRSGSRYVNRFYAVQPDGEVALYDKKHLFSYGKEDRHYHPGDSRIIFKVKGWTIMPVICYDLRFPVWCRNTLDYDLMAVVANWPVPRIHHWDALLKARAIENQCYVAAVNRTGVDGNHLEYNGHSTVLDMNGEVIRKETGTEKLISCTLDMNALTDFRSKFRFLQDRDTFHF